MFNNPVASENIKVISEKASKLLINEFAIRITHQRDTHFKEALTEKGRDLSSLLIEFAHLKNQK